MLTKEDIEAFEDDMEQDHKWAGIHQTPLEMVTEYHKTANLTCGETFHIDHKDIGLRDSLIEEEASEVLAADEPEHLLKELADLVYVAYGYAVTYGWDLDEAVRRVHENNVGRMYQPDGTIKRREDGKILKNPDYPKINLIDLV